MPELEAAKVYVCQDCGFAASADDVSDRSPVYECSNCGEVYTKDDTDNGDHKCPSCSRFGGKVGEISCPDCNTGIMEEQDGFSCSECGALFGEKPEKKTCGGRKEETIVITESEFEEFRKFFGDCLRDAGKAESVGDMEEALCEAWDRFHLLFTIDFKGKKRVKNRWK